MVREINTKCVGVTFENRQDAVKDMSTGDRVFWVHEEDNPYDKNCIALYADSAHEKQLGYLNKGMAQDFVLRMRAGIDQEIYVTLVTGGGEKKSYGLNMRIVVHDED